MHFDHLARPVGPATPLSFPLTLADGRIIATVAEASTFLGALTEQQRDTGHWRIAVRMLDIAQNEPSYMKTATMSLQSALLLQGLIDNVRASGATDEANS